MNVAGNAPAEETLEEQIARLRRERFYGEVQITFEAGNVRVMRVTKSVKVR